MRSEKKAGGKFRFVDFIVVLFCLSGAAYSVNLFRLDLFQTISKQNESPIGTVYFKKNSVQRRLSDRVIWDRLFSESPVYSDDMIRVAGLSTTAIHAGGNDITIRENTLVRLRYDKESGEYKINVMSGNIGLVTDSNSKKNVILDINGRQVKASPGTALNAAARDDGMELQVNEGSATLFEEEQNRELTAGEMISMIQNDSVNIVKIEKPPIMPSFTDGFPSDPIPGQTKYITLESPSYGAVIPGLTALRQQTVFRWSSPEAVIKSRFVLSRNSNPLDGYDAIEILDPNRTISLDRLSEGVWYWTVEAQNQAGVTITAQSPHELRVLPVPLLPAPSEFQPAEGYRVGIDEVKKENINFRWSAVPGANAYIFTLYKETVGGREQITQIGPENRTSWATEVKVLGRGNFIWQVEAVNVGRNNAIEQRGSKRENHFVVDVPRPGPVRILNQAEVSQ